MSNTEGKAFRSVQDAEAYLASQGHEVRSREMARHVEFEQARDLEIAYQTGAEGVKLQALDIITAFIENERAMDEDQSYVLTAELMLSHVAQIHTKP